MLRIFGRGIALAAGILVVAVAAFEVQTSWLQSELLSGIARELTYTVKEGPHPHAYRPGDGPHNQRLGYVDRDRFIERLEQKGFELVSQAGLSARHRRFVELGGFPIFEEKSQAGLLILDQVGEPLYTARFPQRVYQAFEAIPPLMVETLLFIENRELLDPGTPRRNPAVDWSRLAAVLPGIAIQMIDPGATVQGGSTLATQIEKFRHSPAGQTRSSGDKLGQMISASLRAYRDGVDTSDQRRHIVLDYINSTPLSARSGYGEVNGLGDGLWAWFGASFDEVNRRLTEPAAAGRNLEAKARAFKQVLGLLLAQRRPSHYLLTGRADLDELCDRHLRLLVRQGVIEASLGEAALDVQLRILDAPPPAPNPSHPRQKAASALRTALLGLLAVGNLYQLDRLDLTLRSTINIQAQLQVSAILQGLQDPEVATSLGLYGDRLLQANQGNNPLIISLTVYERGDAANYLRIQADNLDQPFDVNQGAKLDLGSTAKLRSLISYLEVIAAIHADLAGAGRSTLSDLAVAGPDQLTRWVAATLAWSEDMSLAAVLDAAIRRTYSASPYERFQTGGGLHRFANFNKDDNGRTVTIDEALRHSINLPFVRMMRDIVNYHIGKIGRDILDDPAHPGRADYLRRFAEREEMTFLRRYHAELAAFDPDAALAKLAGQIKPTAHRLAALFRFVRPERSSSDLAAFLRARPATRDLTASRIEALYQDYDPARFTLSDQAYLVRLHPINLWLGRFLQTHRTPTLAEAMAASTEARAASSSWLFKTGQRRAQDRRIRQMLEEQAFVRIHQAWQRLGYPFPSLVPSYATALGSSADRPDALATLVGIILNGGVLKPSARIQALHFAAGTPYETKLERRSQTPARVLAPEIVAVVRRAMVGVVENGTARRLRGAFDSADGAPVEIGAKTGTGDHRRKTFDRGGNLLASEVVSRSATVVFFVGDRLFGNLTIFVPGPEAEHYRFTSSLPAQLLKALAPALRPLMEDDELITVQAPNNGDV